MVICSKCHGADCPTCDTYIECLCFNTNNCEQCGEILCFYCKEKMECPGCKKKANPKPTNKQLLDYLLNKNKITKKELVKEYNLKNLC